MKAAFFRGPRIIKVEEIEPPTVRDGFVIARPKVTGICGSDIHQYYGLWEQPTYAPGHELSAIITEVGKGVDNFSLGDRVCTEVFSHCGRCAFCMTGAYNLCEKLDYITVYGHGGFAEYCLIHLSSLFKLPDKLSFEEGALIEPFAVAYRAFRRSGARPGDKVAIIGSGTIGLFCLASAKAEGIDDIIVGAKYGHQEKMAERMGANYVIRIDKKNLRNEILAFTGGKGVDATIETVAAEASLNDAIAVTRAGGSVCLVGGYLRGEEKLEIEQKQLDRIVVNEIRLVGSNCYAYSGMHKDFDRVISLISSKKVEATSLVTHRFPLIDIAEAFRVAADKSTGSIKIFVYP